MTKQAEVVPGPDFNNVTATVGVLGAGQLARMMALAGMPLGIRFVFLDPTPDACAAPLGEHLCGEYDDPALLDRLAELSDVVTYEFENVPSESLSRLEDKVPVYPNQQVLKVAGDRLLEKGCFKELDIPTPGYASVDSLDDLKAATASLGFPLVLKTCRFGYDGKGQRILKSAEDIEKAWADLGGVQLIAEQFVPFDREVSLVGVRGRNGEMAFYDIAENEHVGGILHLSRSRAGDAAKSQAKAYVQRLLERFDYVGVLALELFQVGDQLMANEMAPRVHNSGHWTIEGAESSQFENHLRAVLGWPLGSTETIGHAAMLNLIGELPPLSPAMAESGAHLHLYGKSPRPGRKIGHITLHTLDAERLDQGVERLVDADASSALQSLNKV